MVWFKKYDHTERETTSIHMRVIATAAYEWMGLP